MFTLYSIDIRRGDRGAKSPLNICKGGGVELPQYIIHHVLYNDRGWKVLLHVYIAHKHILDSIVQCIKGSLYRTCELTDASSVHFYWVAAKQPVHLAFTGWLRIGNGHVEIGETVWEV